MRKLLLLSLAFVLGISFAAPLAAGKGASKELPFHASFVGQIRPFNMDEAYLATRCANTPDGKVTWAVASFEGWGNATHMGRSRVYAEHCSYRPFDGPPDGTYGQGEIIVTAANNDVLLATYDNGISYPVGSGVEFLDDFTVVDGGTGRFAFASGFGIDTGSVNFGDSTFIFEVSGVISYSRR